MRVEMVAGFIEEMALRMSLKGCIRVKYSHRNMRIGTELHKFELSSVNVTKIVSPLESYEVLLRIHNGYEGSNLNNILYSMGLIAITVNVNKKINGVYRHIDFKICKTHLGKDLQIPESYDFFTVLYVRQESKTHGTYMCFVLKSSTDFRTLQEGL